MSMRVCSVSGCPTIYPTEQGSRCLAHKREARGKRVGNKVYSTTAHRLSFRAVVLDRDPICVRCNLAEATVADHWPMSRIELVDAGMNPNDPDHGRGLCARCHNVETAANPNQRGGWADR